MMEEEKSEIIIPGEKISKAEDFMAYPRGFATD